MYKVYFDEQLIHFVSAGDSILSSDLVLRLYGDESHDKLQNIIASMQANLALKELIFLCENIDKSWETFCDLFQILEAAGAVIFNEENKMLMIYRNGKWDLPKGKIEQGEDSEHAAIREVFEECGISGLSLNKQLPTTYHTYLYKGQKTLKKTHWFLMTTKDLSTPVPQLEEGITDVRWMDKLDMQLALKNTYMSIVNLLNEKEINESPGMLE